MKFLKEMKKLVKKLREHGFSVKHPSYKDYHVYLLNDKYPEDKRHLIKKVLIERHIKKVEKSDIIIVLNNNGYIGINTAIEIGVAMSQNKEIFITNKSDALELSSIKRIDLFYREYKLEF